MKDWASSVKLECIDIQVDGRLMNPIKILTSLIKHYKSQIGKFSSSSTKKSKASLAAADPVGVDGAVEASPLNVLASNMVGMPPTNCKEHHLCNGNASFDRKQEENGLFNLLQGAITNT